MVNKKGCKIRMWGGPANKAETVCLQVYYYNLPIKCRKKNCMTTTDISNKVIQFVTFWGGEGL